VVVEGDGDEDVVLISPKRAKRPDGDEDVVLITPKRAKRPDGEAGIKTVDKDGKGVSDNSTTVPSVITKTTARRRKTTTVKKGRDTQPRIQTLDGFIIKTPTKSTPNKTLDDFITKTPTGVTPIKNTLDDFVIRTPSKVTSKVTSKATLDDFVSKSSPHFKTTGLTARAGNISASTAEAAEASNDLSPTLAALLPLYSSLLTALLLHHGQNPSATPPSFAWLKPHIEKLTHKQITLDTIRRIIWLSHYNLPASFSDGGLHLIDYGASKICIKFHDDAQTRLLDTTNLKARFRQQAFEFCSYVSISAAEIPLASVPAHFRTATISHVLHSKSTHLLKVLKPVKSTSSASPIAAKAKSNYSTLLSRIRAKAAAAPPPPSAEELLQQAAEARVPEVREILRGMRAAGGEVRSLGMRAVVDGIRESVRSPISPSEAEQAVKLACQAELGRWCEVRRAGGVEAVVFGRIIDGIAPSS
jgi:hypothetical protein